MSTEQDYEEMSVEEKLKLIEESPSFAQLPIAAFPPVHRDEYYFVSYSRADYKKVYKDIFALQQQGINIWYDKEMIAGKSWKEIAEERIIPYRCIGVIFYISENSLMSPAIHDEMEYAKANGKICIPINLPIESDIVHNGESVQGKEFSAKEMLDIMRDSAINKEKQTITEKKYELISKMFNSDVIFLHYSDSAEKKKDTIDTAHKNHKQPLLMFEEREDGAVVVGIRDTDVKQVKKEDFVYEDKQHRKLEIVGIGNGAFANCRHLERIYLPDTLKFILENAFYRCGLTSIKIPNDVLSISPKAFAYCNRLTDIIIPYKVCRIHEGTFAGCSNLASITISGILYAIRKCAFDHCSSLTSITITDRITNIGDYAFRGCSGLANITVAQGNPKYHSTHDSLIETATKTLILGCKNSIIPNDGSVKSIGKRAFEGCSGLTNITIPDSVEIIDEEAFSDCSGLTSVTILNGVKSIGERVFAGCSRLVSITMSDSVVSIGEGAFSECSGLMSISVPDRVAEINDYTFKGCSGLTNVTIPNSVTKIGQYAFAFCGKLKCIVFNGTISQWKSVKKEWGWDRDTIDYTVHCTDGDLKKGEF